MGIRFNFQASGESESTCLFEFAKECDCMVYTVVFSILGIVLFGGMVYLFTLIVKALKKYINSDKSQKDK